MDRIEFYKNRNFNERFSASVDFLKQNWKVLYRNIAIGAIPLAIFGGYFMQYYQQASFNNILSGAGSLNIFFMILYFVLSINLMIFLNAMTGAIMIKYGEGKLTPDTGWGNLSKIMFSLSGKTFFIGLILWIIIVIIFAIFAAIIGIFVSGIHIVGMAFMSITMILPLIILLGLLFAFGPSLSLSQYPAYFSETGIWKSISIAFGMGFRNWGSVIVTLLLAGIVLYIVNIIFGIPNIIVTLIFRGEINILTFIVSFGALLGSIITYPIMFIFIAFQYFSIVESEQGISLQSKVEEFENL